MSESTDKNRILVVEDEAIIAEDIRRTLRRLGYAVVGVAHTGDEAVQLARTTSPELVLMDINLRGPLDGVQATALILAELAVPVVYLTGNSDDATLTRASETAPYGYLLKPFDENDLRTTIEIARRKFQLERPAVERERDLTLTLETIVETALHNNLNDASAFYGAIAADLVGAQAGLGAEPLALVLSHIETALSHLTPEAARAATIGGALSDAYAIASQLTPVVRHPSPLPTSLSLGVGPSGASARLDPSLESTRSSTPR